MSSLFRQEYRDKKTGQARKSKKWYGQYRDADGKIRRVPLSPNKSAAQAMLAELVKQAELAKAGVRDPFAVHRRTLMTQHRDDWLAVLTARAGHRVHRPQAGASHRDPERVRLRLLRGSRGGKTGTLL